MASAGQTAKAIAGLVGTHIDGLAYSESGASTVWAGELPDKPDQGVGFTPVSTQSLDVRSPTTIHRIQMIYRQASQDSRVEGSDLAHQIWGLLHGWLGSIGDVYFLQILGDQPPYSVGPDRTGRHRWMSVFECWVNDPTTNRPDY